MTPADRDQGKLLIDVELTRNDVASLISLQDAFPLSLDRSLVDWYKTLWEAYLGFSLQETIQSVEP